MSHGKIWLCFTKEDATRAATSFPHPSTELREVGVRIHDITFDGAAGALIITAVIERDPEAREVFRAAELTPSHANQHRWFSGRKAQASAPELRSFRLQFPRVKKPN